MTLTDKSPPISLSGLFPDGHWHGGSEVLVESVQAHAARVTLGDLFAVIPGTRDDGARHLPEAMSRGAVALLTERLLPEIALPQFVVPHVRRAYALVCRALAGVAATRMPIVGVTGTNGKSTTAWLTRWLCAAAGRRCGLLGTIEYHDGVAAADATLTTPDPATLWHWLQRMAARGCDAVALELSSHALHQDRAAGLPLTVAAVTNVTHDHLDYHGSYEAYWASKARIFDLLGGTGTAVMNLDDPGSRRMLTIVPAGCRTLTLSQEHPAELRAELTSATLQGSTFELHTPWGHREARFPLAGRHNVANALGAIAAALTLGLPLDAVVEGLARFPGVPGRMERIDVGQPFGVVVDYAHTDDALARCLATLRPLTAGRLIVVFGAGGDRDRLKRPKLGRAALAADVAVITSDNPRSEPPETIAAEIAAGMQGGGLAPRIVLDRAAAIQQAIDMALPGDCVVLAGKGHERTQTIGREVRPFEDRDVALAALHRGRTAPAPHFPVTEDPLSPTASVPSTVRGKS